MCVCVCVCEGGEEEEELEEEEERCDSSNVHVTPVSFPGTPLSHPS